jgi:multidrug efflux pump subunit AcrA (membrane-fusion protein)
MIWRKYLPILIFSIAVLSGCSSSGVSKEEEVRAIPVIAQKVARGDIKNFNSIVGQVKPFSEVSVLPKTPGTVKEIFAVVGDVVKKGDVLFTLDNKDVLLQLAQAEAGLSIAMANLERTRGGSVELQLSQLQSSLRIAELAYRDAKNLYDETLKLYQTSGVPRETYEMAQTRYLSALEQYEGAKKALEVTQNRINQENIGAATAQVNQARASYDMARNMLDNMKVISPIDGVVSVRNIEVGSLASVALPALIVVDISRVYVDIQVLEDVYTKISLGDIFEVRIDSVSAVPFKGQVDNVSPSADSRSNTFLVRLILDNPQSLLKGGMLAEVDVVTNTRTNVLKIPIDSVLDDGNEKVVFIVDADQGLRKVVTLGIFDDAMVEVLGDIKENEWVIVKGQNLLRDGDKVVLQ